MTLPNDVQRCTGWMLSADNHQCRQRMTCKRYLAWDEWLRDPKPEFGISSGPATANCQIKIEVEQL